MDETIEKLQLNSKKAPNRELFIKTLMVIHFNKIKISSPDDDVFEDVEVIEELLTQVYQFSRLYWKSLRQQNVPITIKYPEMVAQLVPRFQNDIKDESKSKLWFL